MVYLIVCLQFYNMRSSRIFISQAWVILIPRFIALLSITSWYLYVNVMSSISRPFNKLSWRMVRNSSRHDDFLAIAADGLVLRAATIGMHYSRFKGIISCVSTYD